ncbi:MAG: hypothetical protein FP825_09325 [Hyphomonas sp.]|uniref:NACHT domain-containing protein n=1 Tax=Hyphomonas sp. TaxID=87 RepID=UPI0017A62801|nr:hypothetical protein [Hyphomonas sp.]MBA3068669.1 hypothetical protein [Hyphomonas sp.]MBU4162766.1 hypothetical protein [Alphaproteobacteria bacterium]
MGYHYEELGADRFQELAQGLILASHPNHIVQCLPTGQPDGGRDGLAYFLDPEDDSFFVFQVKFSRNPSTKEDRDAVAELIRTEKHKVEQLILRGAKRYFFITNVKGTSHLDDGSIDKVNSELTQAFGIPTEVWWRDDLDRRVDLSGDIKWSFLDICRAADLMQFLLERPENGAKLEAANSVTAYMAQQYGADRDVKFKQADLKRRLTDLFVDVPLGPKRLRERDRRGFPYRFDRARDFAEYVVQLEDFEHLEVEEEIPQINQGQAAAFLLQMPLFKGVTRLVLEGAPGQGKSTVTQFICQLNRLKLLAKTSELKTVAETHRIGPVRAPFRVDLRDYARWVTGHHPYAKDVDHRVPQIGERSLESFLAMQVSHHAGGLNITQFELIQFFKRAHSVIVLDGFDEVADIETRGRIVEEICKSADRLDALALSMQMIVTSRPAAFANSPGFSEEDWAHLELRDLRPRNIQAYRVKWSEAQDLSDEERLSVETTLTQKLEHAHLRELARNPMQLAILLHLIHVQGHALPDKRTTLYEEYMKLFFNREAEKSAVVRDHRDLLLSIHGVLAWQLQTQAEEGSGAGSITRQELESCVKEYLVGEEHEVALADKLVRGTMERVGALVSRVEGTFEFEVQPLREYFTAWHLYKTAKYSPAGAPKSGAKPDRFNALARSFYWTNVTRFYCGFYDKGELSSLVDGLVQLSEESGYALVNQPRRLAMMLLGDQVFAQSPRTMKQIVTHLVEEPGFERLTASLTGLSQRGMGLPEGAGRNLLFEACARKLDQEPDAHARSILRQVMAANSSKDDLKSFWRTRFTTKRMVCGPLKEASDFGIIGGFATSEMIHLTKDNVSLRLRWLAQSGRYDEIVADAKLYKKAQEKFFDGRLSCYIRRPSEERYPTALEILTETVSAGPLSRKFSDPRRFFDPVLGIHYRHGGAVTAIIDDHYATAPDPTGLGAFAAGVVELLRKSALSFRTRRKPWQELVDMGFQFAAGSELFVRAALISTAVDERFALAVDPSFDSEDGDEGAVDEESSEDAIESQEPAPVWSDEGFAATPGLVDRLHVARSKAEDADWWAKQLFSRSKGTSLLIGLAAFFLWASPTVIAKLRSDSDPVLRGLEEDSWSRFLNWIKSATPATAQVSEPLSTDWFADQPELFHRLSLVLIKRVSGADENLRDRRILARRLFGESDIGDASVLREAASIELTGGAETDVDWMYANRLSMQAEKLGLTILAPLPGGQNFPIPDSVAQDVLSNTKLHCSQWISVCENAYGIEIARRAAKVSKISISEDWFSVS